MKLNGIVIIVLAIAVGLIPQFSDCQSQGRQLTLDNGRNIPMKCHWTAQASLGLALPTAATGALLLFAKRRDAQRNLSLVGAALGVAAILLPTSLIGVCANPDMICHSVMRPTLIFLGTVVSAVGLLGAIVPTRARVVAGSGPA